MGSDVSSPSGVWGGAPAEIDFGAFYESGMVATILIIFRRINWSNSCTLKSKGQSGPETTVSHYIYLCFKKSLNDEEQGGNCLLVPERSYGPGSTV